MLVIPDADQIVKPDFLSKLYARHSTYDKLVVYAYRYDEVEKGHLKSLAFAELDTKCILKNPMNYGGCLSVRKQWLTEINGYEQHKIMECGFHANGMDLYTRFKSYGLAIQWAKELKRFHPWHDNTLAQAEQYYIQKDLIDWKVKNMEYLAIDGIDSSKNSQRFDEAVFMEQFQVKRNTAMPKPIAKPGVIKRTLKRLL